MRSARWPLQLSPQCHLRSVGDCTAHAQPNRLGVARDCAHNGTARIHRLRARPLAVGQQRSINRDREATRKRRACQRPQLSCCMERFNEIGRWFSRGRSFQRISVRCMSDVGPSTGFDPRCGSIGDDRPPRRCTVPDPLRRASGGCGRARRCGRAGGCCRKLQFRVGFDRLDSPELRHGLTGEGALCFDLCRSTLNEWQALTPFASLQPLSALG